MSAETVMIKLTLTPEEVRAALPGFEQGFAERTIGVPTGDGEAEVVYTASYDGESEFIATVKELPENVSSDQAEVLIKEFFLDNSDDDEGDDDDKDEDEEDE
jgi:hypothetical protein